MAARAHAIHGQRLLNIHQLLWLPMNMLTASGRTQAAALAVAWSAAADGWGWLAGRSELDGRRSSRGRRCGVCAGVRGGGRGGLHCLTGAAGTGVPSALAGVRFLVHFSFRFRVRLVDWARRGRLSA